MEQDSLNKSELFPSISLFLGSHRIQFFFQQLQGRFFLWMQYICQQPLISLKCRSCDSNYINPSSSCASHIVANCFILSVLLVFNFYQNTLYLISQQFSKAYCWNNFLIIAKLSQSLLLKNCVFLRNHLSVMSWLSQ